MMTVVSRYFALSLSLVFYGLFMGGWTRLLAMDPETAETPVVATPTASPNDVPANNISASAAPVPEACALKKNFDPLDRTDLCHTFDGTFKHSHNEKHLSFDNIGKLKAFLDAVDAENDPFAQETPLCCNGFTIKGNLIWQVLEPQQAELLQRLKDYCNSTKRDLHLCDRGDTYKGKKNDEQLFQLPITYFETWERMPARDPQLLINCKDTLRMLRIMFAGHKTASPFGGLENLESVYIADTLFYNLKAFGRCQKLHTVCVQVSVLLKDLRPLKDLPSLSHLSLENCNQVVITDLLTPGAFPALRYLCFSDGVNVSQVALAALHSKIKEVVIKKSAARQRPF
ncbi:MAG: hypothetical protein ACPGUZ_01400 [Holosporaceae bacterium]